MHGWKFNMFNNAWAKHYSMLQFPVWCERIAKEQSKWFNMTSKINKKNKGNKPHVILFSS